MEQPNHIDELLRQRLRDASALPPAFVWPRVEAALRKRRRRILFFWLFAAGITGTGLLGWWLKQEQHPNLPFAGQNMPSEQSAEKATPAVSPAADAVRATGNKPERSAVERVKNRQDAILPVEDTAPAVSAQRKRSMVHTKGQLNEQTPAASSGLKPLQQTTSSIAQAAEMPADNTAANQPTEAIPTTDVLSLLTSHLSPLTSHFSPLTSHFSLLTSRPLIPDKRIIRNKKETRNCYDFAEHPNVFLLDAYTGPSLTRKEMRTGPDNQPYLAQRRNTETRDWSFSAGVRGSLLLDRHFLLRSGLHYDQITEVFEFIDPNSVEVTIRQTTQIINGQPVTVIDTLGVEYGEQYLKTFNRFGMLDVPLEVGVELRNGRTGVSLNGGIALNVLFWKRGAILSPVDGQPAYFTPGNGTVDVFRAKAGLSAIGSVQWFYHLRPRLRVFAEPYVRMVLRPVNIPGHPVEQRYGMMGLNVGVTRIFD